MLRWVLAATIASTLAGCSTGGINSHWSKPTDSGFVRDVNETSKGNNWLKVVLKSGKEVTLSAVAATKSEVCGDDLDQHVHERTCFPTADIAKAFVIKEGIDIAPVVAVPIGCVLVLPLCIGIATTKE